LLLAVVLAVETSDSHGIQHELHHPVSSVTRQTDIVLRSGDSSMLISNGFVHQSAAEKIQVEQNPT